MSVYVWRLIVICDYPNTSIMKISFGVFCQAPKGLLFVYSYGRIREKAISFRGLWPLTS